MPPYKGIHTIYSGFNGAPREYYPLLDPIVIINRMAKKGKLILRPIKESVLIYKPDEVGDTATKGALKRIIDDDSDDESEVNSL
ncbi:hypothetical protein ACFLV9_00540 [Chloroflexota bacterium]